MEIKKVSKGYDVDGVLFQRKRDALHYLRSYQRGETEAPSWASEKIEYSYDTSHDNPSFKRFIYSYLEKKSWSMSYLAEKLDISRPTLYAWMDAQSMPEESRIQKLCKVLKTGENDIRTALIDNFKVQNQKFLSPLSFSHEEIITMITACQNAKLIESLILRHAQKKSPATQTQVPRDIEIHLQSILKKMASLREA